MRISQVFVLAVGSLFASLPIQASNFNKLPAPDTLQAGIQQELLSNQLVLPDHSEIDSLYKQMNAYGLPPLTIEGRLKHIQKQVPLTYNDHIETLIEQYSTERYKSYFGRMMGLGAYYFEIYDQIFKETGLPSEIKYLSVIESALNPHAVSRMGATGPWQFMFATAKGYNLTMDSYMDERKDPISASYAASSYLKDAYAEFGDWLLAIAAYNCGKGNVTRAIKKSGLDSPNFWQIRSYLPKETQNYIPKFIAMTYVMEFHVELGIVPLESSLPKQIEWVNVQQHVPITTIASALNVDQELIKTLNPAYKRGVIHGTELTPRRLILPAVSATQFDTLYMVLNHPESVKVIDSRMLASNADRGETLRHKVKRGETLGKIATHYRVTVQDLKAWNQLKNNTIMPGQHLDIHPSTPSASPRDTQQLASNSYLTYVVRSGDTLSGIAQKHSGNTVSSIKSLNGMKDNRLKPGMKLKVSKI